MRISSMLSVSAVAELIKILHVELCFIVADFLYFASANSDLTLLNLCWGTFSYLLLPAKMETFKGACIGFTLGSGPRLVVCSTFQEFSIRRGLVSHCNRSFLKLQVKCQGTNDSLQNSLSKEPKWKEKLAAADENAQRMRMQSQQIHEEYKRRIATLERENLQGPTNACSLEKLEFISYLDDEGLIVDKSASDAKASVYAIFDQNKTLQYVGISRQVYLSMKLHFARVPSKCHFVKMQHLNKPNRALLEHIKEKWIEENGLLPGGNDNGPQQQIWENPLDCKPLMTEEEKQKLDSDPVSQQAKILKNVARRIEKELDVIYRERNCNEKFWFDPKLKEKGLLELRNKKPNQSVPTAVPKPKSAS